MARNDFVVSDGHTRINKIIELLEEADGIADEIVTQYNAVGGAAALTGYTWPDDLTEAEFTTAISTLASKPWSIAGTGHDTNLYKVKTAF